MKPAYDLPILKHSHDFESLVQDLFNAMYPNQTFQKVGVSGQSQDGIDIYSHIEEIGIQCKKVSLNRSGNVLKVELNRMFEEDLSKFTESDFNKRLFVFATTYKRDVELQKKAASLNKTQTFTVQYWGWDTIVDKLHEHFDILLKYYGKFKYNENDEAIIMGEKNYEYEDESVERNIDTNAFDWADNIFAESVRDKNIIEQMFLSLKRFDGLSFVDPKTISRMFPFRKESNNPKSDYEHGCLSTDNEEIQGVLKKVQVVSGKPGTVASSSLKGKDIERLTIVFSALNRSQIKCIQTPDREHNTIYLGFKDCCSCMSCEFSRLHLDEVVERLKSKVFIEEDDKLLIPYMNYKVGKYKESFEQLEIIRTSSDTPIQRLICSYNISKLHNFLRGHYWLKDRSELLEKTSRVDYQSELCKLDADPFVKRELQNILTHNILRRVNYELDDILIKLSNVKRIVNHGGTYSGPNHISLLNYQMVILYAHYNANRVMFDEFLEYEKVCAKTWRGLLLGHSINKDYPLRLNAFTDFHLRIAQFHISTMALKEIFIESQIKEIEIEGLAIAPLTDRVVAYLRSHFKEGGLFGNVLPNELIGERLHDHAFSATHRRLFTNGFFLLSRLKEVPEANRITENLVKYLKTPHQLGIVDVESVTGFLYKNATQISIDTIKEFLKLMSEQQVLQNSDVFRTICEVFSKKGELLEDSILVQKLILLSEDRHTGFKKENLVYLHNVCCSTNQTLLKSKFKNWLNSAFDYWFYRTLLIEKVLNWDEGNYFSEYVVETNKNKGSGNYYKKGDVWIQKNHTFLNFIISIQVAHVPLNKSWTENLTNLSNYHLWLLDPKGFDYSKFQVCWLILANNKFVLDRTREIQPIKQLLEKELTKSYNPELSEIYFDNYS